MDEITKEAFKLYHPPFKYVLGYIYDSKDNMVADYHNSTLRTRGWGRMCYMNNADKMQDAVGDLIAKSLTAYWQEHLQEAIK